MPAPKSSLRSAGVSVTCLAGLCLAACATPQYGAGTAKPVASAKRVANPQAGGRYMVGAPYQIGGIWYVPSEQPHYDQTGVASWYGEPFHNRRTANGEIFDMFVASAAHTTLPLPSIVEVTNLDNGKRIQVRVNDRGPFYGGRIIDLSRAAAEELGFYGKGTAKVRVRYVGPAPLLPSTARPQLAANSRAPAAAPPPSVAVTPPSSQAASTVAPQPVQVADTTAIDKAAPSADLPAVADGFLIQAGAFSSRDNAERAVAQLATAGQASIRPMERNGGVLYRVVIGGWSSQAQAAAALDRVAAAGFADARVIQGF